jgi:tetratricopeptide (TPR) repeat protein
MGIFDIFGQDKQNREVTRIFKKIHDHQKAKELVDKAISYRTLEKYDKAIALLKEGIMKYPSYTPALSVLGNTFRDKGDVLAAEQLFLKILADYGSSREYALLIETYANLGSIYYFEKGDNSSALIYYDASLKVPKPEGISTEGINCALSDIYRDLVIIHTKENDFPQAKKYAALRLKFTKDCPIALNAYGLILINEYTTAVYIASRSPLKNEDKSCLLYDAIQNFTLVLSNNPDSYPALAGIGIASFHLKILYDLYVQFPDEALRNHGMSEDFSKAKLKSIEELESNVITRLSQHSGKSQEAGECLRFYESQVSQVYSFLGLK